MLTLCYYGPQSFWAIFKETNDKCLHYCGKEEPFHITCRNVCKYTVTTDVSVVLPQMELPYDPDVPLLGAQLL